MTKTEATLERLASCGKCSCPNVKDYAEQLRQLALQKADREIAKRRGRFFKALGDETRQRMLGLLTDREMCVCELMTALEMTQPTTSHHLKILEDAGIIQGNKEGKWVFYSVQDKQMLSTLIEATSE
jgi:DNA-binding transcriptional ArsR family regulator